MTAEFWLRKATLVSGKQDKEANILFQKVRVKRLFDPLTKDFPIAVDFLQYGRALIAKRDIKAGEVLFYSEAFICSSNQNYFSCHGIYHLFEHAY